MLFLFWWDAGRSCFLLSRYCYRSLCLLGGLVSLFARMGCSLIALFFQCGYHTLGLLDGLNVLLIMLGRGCFFALHVLIVKM